MCRLARGSHAFHREVKAWETLEKTRGVIPDDDTDKDKENTEDTEVIAAIYLQHRDNTQIARHVRT